MNKAQQDNTRQAMEILKRLAENLHKIPEPMIGYAVGANRNSVAVALSIAYDAMERELQTPSPDKSA